MIADTVIINNKTFDELETLYWLVVNEWGWGHPVLKDILQLQGEIVLGDLRKDASNEN